MRGTYTRRKLRNAKKWICSRPYYIRRFFVRKLVKNKNFSVISNNCWGGRVYSYLGLPYLTPTAGLFFMPEDYIRFVSDLQYYLSLDLKFIKGEESRHYAFLKENNQADKIIGVLDDVEIVFLHYGSEEEAKEKWNRRKERVNYDHIILKFSNMRGCTEEQLAEFDALPFSNKFVLNIRKKTKYESEVYWRGKKKNYKEILNDSVPFPSAASLPKLLNKPAVPYPKETGLRTRATSHQTQK